MADDHAALERSRAWAAGGLSVHARARKGLAALVLAAGELPIPPRQAYELMSHPDNAAIFRGIERCTYRRVLWAAADCGRPGDGRQTVEVENESDWHFLFFKGSIRTRMLVHEDPTACTIHVRLAPAGGNAPLQHLSARWRFEPGKAAGSCHVSLEQEVHPKGLPPFFHNAFRAMAALQVRKTFEDLYAEALRMNAGRPSLAPYASVARKEVAGDAAAGAGAAADSAAVAAARALAARLFPPEDPSSVLSAYDADSASSTSGGGGGGGGARGAPRGGLRSHPIGSLVDLACLAGATGASIAAEVAAHAAAAAQAAAAEAAGAAAPTWRGSLYALLQKVWVASNAALGLAPNAVAELEEMAVLV